MMFLLDLAFATGLIALGVGVVFLVWAYRNDGAGIALARVFGYIITIAAMFVLLCTTYYGPIYWAQGYFKSPMAPMLMMKQKMMRDNSEMMQRMKQMYQQPMMQKKGNSMETEPHQHQNNSN